MEVRLTRVELRTGLWWIAVLASALIPLYLLAFILQGSKMQFGDYFYMLSSIFTPSGAFRPSGLLVHANEHLIALPKLVYAGNVRLFAGSNITLGVFVWLVSLATLLLLLRSLSDLVSPRSVSRIVLVWLLVATAFPLRAMHNYVFGMSGTAWILANFLVLVALALAVRSRIITAGVTGVLATFTYGTGMAVWPVLVLILILRRVRLTWRDGVMLALGVFSVLVERSTGGVIYGHPPATWNPLVVVRSLTISVGSLFTDSVDLAALLGVAVLAVWAVNMRHILPDPLTPAVLFAVAISSYATIALLLVAISRGNFGDEALTGGRYMTLAALASAGTLLVALPVWRDTRLWVTVTGAVTVLVLVSAVPTIQHFEEVVFDQEVASVAARLDVAKNGFLRGYEEGSGPLLRDLGSYPFNDDQRFDCGLLGSDVTSRLVSDPDVVIGALDNISVSPNPAAVNVSGWAYSASSLKCVLILDEGGRVIGAGVLGGDRQDVRSAYRYPRSDVGWRGVALRRAGAGVRAAAVVKDSDRVYVLDDPAVTEVP